MRNWHCLENNSPRSGGGPNSHSIRPGRSQGEESRTKHRFDAARDELMRTIQHSTRRCPHSNVAPQVVSLRPPCAPELTAPKPLFARFTLDVGRNRNTILPIRGRTPFFLGRGVRHANRRWVFACATSLRSSIDCANHVHRSSGHRYRYHGRSCAGAKVTLLRVQTRETRVTMTDGSGNYSFPLIEIGDYTVSVEKQGFKTQTTRRTSTSSTSKKRASMWHSRSARQPSGWR